MSHFGSNLFLITTCTILLLSALLSIDHSKILTLLPFTYTNRDSYSNYDDKKVIPIVSAVGPESLAFDPHGGGPYTGVSDGRIIKWLENKRWWIDFTVTSTQRDECQGSQVDHEERENICGRPLGLRFDERTGNLYIADAYMGLLVVGPEGGLATKVATQAQGISFGFTNSLDIDERNGIVCFSDSSSRFQRRNHISVIVGGDRTGRLMKYNPQSKETTVLLQNLTFPNGVSLSKGGDFVLVADTTNCRILKLRLEPSSNSGMVEVFDRLPGFPDNIKRNHRGEFWVGIHAKRGKFLKWVLSFPLVGQALIKLPFDITKVYSYFARWGGNGLTVRLSGDGDGDVLEALEDEGRIGWKAVSEVEERDGNLWIGSIRTPFVGVQYISPLLG